MESSNAYDDRKRAEAYARLQSPGTYYLAVRDPPQFIARYCTGNRALDFGCGAGRLTRFLKQLGFAATGVDISAEMLRKAKEFDTGGDCRMLGEDGFAGFPSESFDLLLSAFTFDNIPERAQKVAIMRDLRRLLKSSGAFVNLVSSPEIYYHEWASFATKDFAENRLVEPGDIVKIINTDIDDARPVDDILWPIES